MKYLNFSNSVLNFFWGLLIITFASIFFFAPSGIQETLSNEEIPKIELNGFNMYQINTNFVDMKVQGSKALQYDTREILYGFLASRYNGASKNLYEFISGDKVIRKNDEYYFPQGVVYLKSDGGRFWSKSGVYYYQKETFVGKGDFIFDETQGQFKGKDIFYDRKAQIVKAIDINSKINLDSKKEEKKK